MDQDEVPKMTKKPTMEEEVAAVVEGERRSELPRASFSLKDVEPVVVVVVVAGVWERMTGSDDVS